MKWNIKDIFNYIFGDLSDLKKVLKNKYFYISVLILVGGIWFNFLSQTYLNDLQTVEGDFPPLYDLVLDNIPYIPLGFIYDWAMIISLFIFIFYVIYTRQYKKIPYYITVIGSFMVLRGFFIILTPLGNPLYFSGTNSKLGGLSKYELGLYPSGHTAAVFNYFLLSSKKLFKIIFFIMLLFVIVSLLLTRAHYSIDILSGLIFAYAINCFAEKYLTKWFVI